MGVLLVIFAGRIGAPKDLAVAERAEEGDEFLGVVVFEDVGEIDQACSSSVSPKKQGFSAASFLARSSTRSFVETLKPSSLDISSSLLSSTGKLSIRLSSVTITPSSSQTSSMTLTTIST